MSLIRKKIIIFTFFGILFLKISVNATKNNISKQENNSNIKKNSENNLELNNVLYEKNKENLKKEYTNSNLEKNNTSNSQINLNTDYTKELKKTNNNKTEYNYNTKDLEKRDILYKELHYLHNLLKLENSTNYDLEINKLMKKMKTKIKKIYKNKFDNLINKTKINNIKYINNVEFFVMCNTKKEIFHELIKICSELKKMNFSKNNYEKIIKLIENDLNKATTRINNNMNYAKINIFIKSKQLFDNNFYRTLAHKIKLVNQAIVKLYKNFEEQNKSIKININKYKNMYSILEQKIYYYIDVTVKYKIIIDDFASFLNSKNEDIVVVANLYTFDFPDFLQYGNVLSKVLNSFLINNNIHEFINNINNYLKKLEETINSYIKHRIDDINKTIFEKYEINTKNENWIKTYEIKNIYDVLNNLKILSTNYPNESLYDKKISFFKKISNLKSILKDCLKLN